MSVLRKKYFSVQSQTYVDIPTTALQTFSSLDVGSNQNEETIRLIKFGDNVNSSRLDEVFVDLLHNDKKLFDEYQKINSLISNGSFYNIGDNFQIYDVKKETINTVDYIKSFGIKSGQIKYNDEIVFLEPTSFYTTIKTTAFNTNIIEVNSTNDLNTSQNSVEIGSVIFGTEFQSGTQVLGITGTSVELSKDLKAGYTLASGSLVLFMNIPTFEIGQEINNIGNYNNYPVYRRDLICYDLKTSSWEILKGSEITTIPPINTQLDVIYQILSITRISGSTHQLKLKKSNRILQKTTNQNTNITTGDFAVGEYLTLSKTDNKTFDGAYEITSIDSINYTININVPLYRDNSNDQTTFNGFVDLKKVGIISVLLYKINDNSPEIIDSLDNITLNAGITGGVQNIIHAPIDHYNSYYSIKTNDKIHLTDIKGRLLDWEDGQGSSTDPVVGYAYNEDESQDYYLKSYNETNIPHPHYANIDTGNLTNIPFILREIDNNVFGLKFVDLISFNIGIKNNTVSIGQEGITYRVVTYDQLSDPLNISNIQSLNTTPAIKRITNNSVNFLTDYNITIRQGVSDPEFGSDFILISSGKGYLQIGKIVNKYANQLDIVGLYKDIDTTSQFIIFKNETSVTPLLNSEQTITSDSIKSQVLSGINGTFGIQNSYSKVSIGYNSLTLTQIPKIESSKWYFLSLKGYNDPINPQQQGTPFIVTEDPDSGNSDASSSFIEIYYRTVSGNYPGENFNIEDEFGNITTQYNDRSQAPHFRPVKYQVLARALDRIDDTVIQAEDEVFVDVHIGKFKFHPEAIPRRTYVSYNKLDVLDGDSTDFSIKHIDVKDTDLKINLQDKLSDIDYRFNQENTVEKAWKFNGIVSNESFGFSGPINVDINDSYNVIYKYGDIFDNFLFDEENYVVKFSNHLYDKPVYVGKSNLLLENISLEVDINNDFRSSTLIENFNFVDYESGVSAVTLPFIGINFYDEAFIPSNDGFYSTVSDFYRKKLVFETPSEKSEMSIDSGLYDVNYSINSTWNYLYSAPFDKNMVLYGSLRKTSGYESILNFINANTDIKRRLKQREFVKLLDKNLNDLNSNKSITKIISEKYLSKSLVLDSTKYKENLLYLKSEIIKYKFYEFLHAQNISNTTLGLTDINQGIIGFNDLTLKKSTVFINNSLISAFIVNSIAKVKIIKFEKTEESSDIGGQSTAQPAEIIVSTVSIALTEQVIQVRISKFNDDYFAVAYVSLIGTDFFITIKIYSYTGVLQTNATRTLSFPITSPYLFEIGDIGINRLGIVFPRSNSQIGLITYFYFPTIGAVESDIKIIESELTLDSFPSICKFSNDLFLVGYSNNYGLKIKIFDQEGKLQFFDDNQTIDYRTVTNNTIPLSGNLIKVLELDNNDIAILFLDRDIEQTYSLKLIILDAWTKNWKYPTTTVYDSSSIQSSPIYIEKGLTDNFIQSINMSVLNEDIFIISYIKSGNIILKSFYNDGGELFNSFNHSFASSSNSISLNTVGQSTLISTYINNNNYKYSVYNFRPNFNKNIISNNSHELSSSTNGYYFKNLLLDSNNFIFINQVSSTTYDIKVISTINKTEHVINSNYNSLTGLTFNKILDVFFINEDNFKVINILWTDNTNIKISFIKIKDQKLNKSSDDLTITPNTYNKTFGKILQIQDRIIGILLATNDRKYNIHGANLSIFETQDNFGTTGNSNYTNSSGNDIKYWGSGVGNPLSGVNVGCDVIFYKKNNSLNSGYLIYPQASGTNLSYIRHLSNLYTNTALDFSNLISEISFSTVSSNRQYNNGINFVKDKLTNDNIYLLGNSSGSLDYYSVNFSQDGASGTTIASGQFFEASGTSFISDKPDIFNSSYDDGLVLFYASTSGVNNYYNVSFLNKSNKAFSSSLPTNIFSESSLGTKISTSKVNDVDDFYSTFISNNKIYSKTLTLPFTDDFEKERVLVAEENRKRLYVNNSIKIGGINWKGQVIKNFPIYSIDSFNLDYTQIDNDQIFRSEILDISAHLISTSKDSFTVLYYYKKNKVSERKVKLRRFIIARSRIFPDSNWFSNDDISYEDETANDIYLQAIEYGINVLYVWVDPNNKKINKVLSDSSDNSSIGNTSVINSDQVNTDWILLGSSKLIEGWSTVLGYEKISNKLYTMLFDYNGDLIKLGEPFNLPFDIRTTTRSHVSISKFGYFIWLYIDSNKNLKYYQHGFDGDPWGAIQLVGRNYITNIETSSNSPIYNDIKSNVLKTEEFKFLQYNRIDFTIPNGKTNDIYEIFGSQETGFYRIFNLDDPTLNLTMALKVSTDINVEPTAIIDTSSVFVSQVEGTGSSFNIYISSSSNYVTFQNKTGSDLRLRFYKEN